MEKDLILDREDLVMEEDKVMEEEDLIIILEQVGRLAVKKEIVN
jgi:hypothetical protein